MRFVLPLLPRPTTRSRSRALRAAGLAVLLAVVASCGTGEDPQSQSDSSAAGGGGTADDSVTIAIGFTEEVDPDVFFDLELGSVTNAVYDTLLRYEPGGSELEGVLAESWEVSPDGLTFTFHLRDGLTFADGSTMDSTSIQQAFERKAAVQGAPSYILAEVAGYETPDPQTFVITLSSPVNNFLYRLASPAGSLITNPAVIAANETDGDMATGWLGTHSAGSGPYVIESFVPDDRIVLTRNENYWGTKPYYRQVVFKVIPDTSSQQLQTEQGDVDLMSGIGPEAAAQITAQGKVALDAVQGYNQMFFQVNVTKPPFDDPAVIQALQQSIPYQEIVDTVLGEYGTVSTQLTPNRQMPEGTAVYAPELDPDAFATATADADKSATITMGQFTPDSAQIFARVNEYVAEILRDAGYQVDIVQIPTADYFGFVGAPDIAPNLMLTNQPGDGSQPANWFDLFFRTDGALNVGGVGTPEIDELLAAGNAVPTGEDPDYDAYDTASDLIRDQGASIPIADVNTLYVHSLDLDGVEMMLVLSPAIWVADLKPKGP